MEHVQAIYVLSGMGIVRVGKDRVAATVGSYFAFPPGLDEVAHQLINTSDTKPLRYLMIGTSCRTDICG